ncbi:hypothetical protein HPB50_009450 [Hyalomma asiaticum]|uniref:Uncharacterized protein n=1 Tax=Hyalomma asiaticum TaxID=266040 RepID=A0ACB7SSX1_HYAAI|nr:hypothetical protein HPB50_009450 [Hyalomma asiaticum]
MPRREPATAQDVKVFEKSPSTPQRTTTDFRHEQKRAQEVLPLPTARRRLSMSRRARWRPVEAGHDLERDRNRCQRLATEKLGRATLNATAKASRQNALLRRPLPRALQGTTSRALTRVGSRLLTRSSTRYLPGLTGSELLLFPNVKSLPQRKGLAARRKTPHPLLRDVLAPSKDLRFREKTRRSPVGSYADAAGAYAPYWPGPSQERGLYMPECRRPTFAPASRSAPVCIADELNYFKFAEAAVRPVLHYPEVYPPPPAPLVPPPVAPPAFPNDCVADRLCASRRRTRSFPRRLPERRLYDAHGRWVGHERRSLQDFDEEGWSLSVQHQTCRDGLCSHVGGRELRSNYDVPRGYGRRHSWSHSTVLDDDAEDLPPADRQVGGGLRQL